MAWGCDLGCGQRGAAPGSAPVPLRVRTGRDAWLSLGAGPA